MMVLGQGVKEGEDDDEGRAGGYLGEAKEWIGDWQEIGGKVRKMRRDVMS
jgi:hypothetical protein